MKEWILLLLATAPVTLQAAYVPPANNRVKLNLDYDWKFNRADVAGSETLAFNDSAWKDVSLPHTYNDIDHYDTWVTGSGDYGWAGKTWYRKHFKLDATYAGRRVLVELEGVRQAASIYINGTYVGLHENGVGPIGVDISGSVQFGATDNVLAVKVDNTLGYKEVATATGYDWDTPPFNPNYGGIVKNVWLHVMDKVHQTLPLYSNLGTTGTYIYATNINPAAQTADITSEAQVHNDNTTSQSVSYEMVVVDAAGNAVLTKTAAATTIPASGQATLKATGSLTGAHLWAPDYPYLYTVYTTLKIGATAVDVVPTSFGIRSVTFNATDGLLINGRPLYLKGYAPRSTMEWPNVGMGPNWLEEYDLRLMKDSGGNFIRPMHVAPKAADVEAADRVGILYVVPAGNAEGDGSGRQWDQRVELMRDVTIYYKNHPSVVFWEASNSSISPDHMTQMKSVNKQWDPNGGRLSGTRGTDSALWPIAEFLGSMDNPGSSNILPLFDCEYARQEAPRRVWDKYSPPSFGYVNIANACNNPPGIVEYPQSGFLYNSSEDLARANVLKYNDRWSRRGGQGLSAVMTGGAKIIFADSVSHGRMCQTELARVSGAVDGARLPKETFYALQAAQRDTPTVNILGHWNYPAGTVKNMYVMANTEQVKLVTYTSAGAVIKDYGFGTRANTFEFGFTGVAWQAGKVVATGYNGGMAVASQQIVTAGAATKIRLTPIVGPQGWLADGVDVAMFDVEVTDAAGVRHPLDEARVDFTASGAGVFLGGYNSGVQNSIFQTFLSTEAGINRVFVRATRTAGTFTLTASRSGLTAATASITSTAFPVTNGVTTVLPQIYPTALGTEPSARSTPTPNPRSTPTPTPTATPVPVGVTTNFAYTGTDGSLLSPPMPQAHVVTSAAAGMPVYVDSSATFPTLPSYLQGGDYIQAFLRDAGDTTSTDLYQFFMVRYGYIYQLIDAANAMPTHDNNASYQWTKLSDTIVINGRTHNIYKSRLMAPGEQGYFASNGYGITMAPGSNLYVVFAVSAEVPLQAPGQPVAVSSAEAGNPGPNAIDGNTTTRWAASAATFPQWITVDLGQKDRIGGFTTTWYNAATRSYKYKIELSDDNAAYAVAVDKQTNTAMGVSSDRTSSTMANQGRYVRITVVGASAGFASISELQIVGVAGGASATPTPTRTPTPTATATATMRATPTATARATPTATAPGGVLLSQGQPATASSFQVGNEVAKGNDGSLTTRWAASDATFPQWWRVDLGAPHNLSSVTINWLNSATRSFKYKIEVSADGATYQTSVDKTANTAMGDTNDAFSATGARYVRITVTGASAGWASFYESKVFGN